MTLNHSHTPMKVAKIVGVPGMCSDDGRALTYGWNLYLNDHGGVGFWHGGPALSNHASYHSTEEGARERATSLGYEVQMTAWT